MNESATLPSPKAPLLAGRTTRQWAVLVGTAAALVGNAIGVGAFGGTPIAEAAGGALGADATWVAPATPAFGIWTPIYLGLVGYALWQAARSWATDARQVRVGWWLLATLVLNAAWVLVVQAGWLALSVAVLVLLLVALVRTWVLLLADRPRDRVEAVVLDGTVGLYLGWVCVATVAGTAAWLEQAGWSPLLAPRGWAVVVLVVAAAVGVLLASVGRGRVAGLTAPAAIVWGLTWVAVGRSDGGRESVLITWTAALAAVTVLVAALLLTRQSREADRPAVADPALP